jgi:autotransporter translocation and assembly factor TamB
VLPENDDDPLVYDLRGRTRHLDLRRLPRQLDVPSAATNVTADYHIRGTGSAMTGDASFQPSTVAGARIAAGSTAAFSKNGTRIGYAADATVADLDLRRFGEQFKIAALADDRYTSAINGHIAASGHGTTPEEMELTANGTLTDSSIFGGRIPRLSFDAALAHDTVHVKATGDVADLDPAVAAERPSLQGRIGGAVDIDATLLHVSRGVTADSVQGTAKVDLQPSTIGGLDVTRAALDADYHDSTGDIRTLQIVGRDINVEASGTLALNDTGSSNLKVHADSPSLDQIGKLANQPLTGTATLDSTVTGNKRELHAAGTFTGDGITYGDNGALTISGDYTVGIPDLAVADANVTADTHATFVTLAGQNINELDGKTTYHQKQVEFDMTAKQPARSVGATGLVLLHPDHQEVHLQKLGLQTAGVAWQLEPGAEATVNYAQDRVAVANLKLVSADQHITADGSFGRPGDALHVTLDNVDLAGVDAILLREPQLSGRLHANGTVTGTREAPNATADFHVDQGGFRQFHYDTFGGTFSYAGRGLTLDAKLQQNPSTFITAKGYLPTAVFSAISAEERAAAHGTTAAPEDRVDLHVESTPIDLGLLQGLTTELTNVTGTLQAKIDVTGSAADPHPNGLVTVLHGAFTVPSTGASYTNLDGKIELQPDRVHVGAISVLDNHLNPLVVSGDLAIHERAVSGVQVYIHSDDFKVIDNKMGNVRINSDMQIAGELRAPRIEGDLGVTTGTINLDPILAQIGDSAYATKPVEYTTPATDAAGQTPVPNAFEALEMNVHVTVPDDLVVKSTDLQAPGSPVGLGAMTVTLGGDVRATKEPRGQIALVGAVNTVRGFYDFRGRRFEILRDGKVRFGGEALSELDPILDIRTRRLIQGVEAHVNVRGTLREPEIALASTPPLEDADILSLIVFNQPVNQLGETQQMNLVQQAQYLAGGALTGGLARSIAEALNLNEFDINLAPESGRGPQVTLGQQLGQNLYVKVQQGIGDQSQTNFVLEYELSKWLRLQTNVLQGSSTQQQLFQRMQGSGVDLLFFFSY